MRKFDPRGMRAEVYICVSAWRGKGEDSLEPVLDDGF